MSDDVKIFAKFKEVVVINMTAHISLSSTVSRSAYIFDNKSNGLTDVKITYNEDTSIFFQ